MVYTVKMVLKISPKVLVDLNTNEYRKINYNSYLSTVKNGVIVYFNDRRVFETPFYVVKSNEFCFGPFRCFEEAKAELVYLRDPLSLNYVPGQEYHIVQL